MLTDSQLEYLVEGFYHAIDKVDCNTITYEDCEKALHYALKSLEAK